MKTRQLVVFFVALAGWLHADTVQYAYDAAGRLTNVTYANGTIIAYTYDKAGNLLKRSVTSPQSSGPQISAGGVVNGASFQAPLARGELATIFGSNLASSTASASQLPLPTTLGGAQVSVAGTAAPLVYASPTQINFQVPFEAPTSGNVAVVVTVNGTPSPAQNAAMAEYAPGVFTYARTATVLDPIIVHGADNTLVTPGSPAAANEVLVIYATGVGSFDNPPATGTPAVGSPLARALVTPTVTVGSSSGAVIFAGLTPGFVGLVQVNVQLPGTLASGTQQLELAFGSSKAPAVNLYVK
jgi:uncharacterized protein (TIGR03437 family)